MKLKTITTADGKTYAEVSDGKPLFIGDDGKEIAFDAPGTVATISRLNGEAKGHREGKEAAEAALKVFEGLDATAAKDALAKLKTIDDKKLIDAGEVEKVKAEAIKATEEKYAPIVKENETLKGQLDSEMIGGAFSRSKYATDKLAIPADFVQARFGTNFKREDGKVVGYDQAGNKLYSKARPGELADFDEALELLVDAYPQKASILKGNGHSGGGGKPGNGQGGGKTITRAEFNQMTPPDQAAKVREGFTVTE
ncbi:hypothetical protein HGP14_09600 [Rhizobium sp. P32RR-XVIII]|uniref:DUF6651 domain-containing protein n=1 Tax=Rhizobium sp. P32RR-XVIII TaxID=2726738 RepID=UPI0014567595|nr:DUF6651 domain-containing protein [Rhizobium sp. P32RR-XVIII]NLS03612.1 hypothetical protein [Rhizobium sp. P32RR-XVIII]